MRPPSRWRCALTSPSRVTSHKSRRLSPTPASYTQRLLTQISYFNIGLPPSPSSRCLHKAEERPFLPQSILLRFPQKRHGHAYIPITQSQTQSLSDSTILLLPLFRHWPHQCQHHRHQQHPQPIIIRQIKQCTPQRCWSHLCISPSNIMTQWWRKWILVHLRPQLGNHRCCTNTNLGAPLSKLGWYATNDPPIPFTDRDVQGRGLLRRSPQLDLHHTGVPEN